MTILRTTAAVAAAVLAIGAGACEKAPNRAGEAPLADGTAAAAPIELGAAAQLDSGNSAYRGRQYAEALGHYRQATERAPTLAAAWFGVYMAQTALGNRAGADSAMRKVQELAPGTLTAHPEGRSPGPLPAGHPSTGDTSALPPGHPGPVQKSDLPPGHPTPSPR